jgi:hypothetical protein
LAQRPGACHPDQHTGLCHRHVHRDRPGIRAVKTDVLERAATCLA